jgi:hypothetical protein
MVTLPASPIYASPIYASPIYEGRAGCDCRVQSTRAAPNRRNESAIIGADPAHEVPIPYLSPHRQFTYRLETTLCHRVCHRAGWQPVQSGLHGGREMAMRPPRSAFRDTLSAKPEDRLARFPAEKRAVGVAVRNGRPAGWG